MSDPTTTPAMQDMTAFGKLCDYAVASFAIRTDTSVEDGLREAISEATFEAVDCRQELAHRA